MPGDANRDTDVFIHEFQLRQVDVRLLLSVPLSVTKGLSTVAQQ
jgi:hypothetical protein